MHLKIMLVTVISIAMTAAPLLAATPDSSSSGSVSVTDEQRQAMARMHEQMAGCLRSGRPISECKMQMMEACRNHMADKQACSMSLGGMMHHHASDSSASHHSAKP